MVKSMDESKESSDSELSLIDKISSSIEDIEKESKTDESKDKTDESDDKKSEEDIKEISTGLPLNSIKNLFIGSKRKRTIMSIIGIIIGIIFILSGVSSFLSKSDRIVDNVAFGETGAISVVLIFVGILILGVFLTRMFTKKNPLTETFNNIKDLELLDEETYDKNTDSQSNSSKSKSKLEFSDSKSPNTKNTSFSKSKSVNDDIDAPSKPSKKGSFESSKSSKKEADKSSVEISKPSKKSSDKKSDRVDKTSKTSFEHTEDSEQSLSEFISDSISKISALETDELDKPTKKEDMKDKSESNKD